MRFSFINSVFLLLNNDLYAKKMQSLIWFLFLVNLVLCRMLVNLLCHQNLLLRVTVTWRRLPRKNGSELKSCLKAKESNMDLILASLLLLRVKRLLISI